MSKHHTPKELIEGFSQLYTLPAMYFRIKAVVENPAARTEDLVREITLDPALTLRVLRLVNSPLYATSGKVETVLRAVHVLGHRAIHDLVLATSVTAMIARRNFGEFDMHAHWRHSLLIGIIARSLGAKQKLVDRERLFVEGLLSRLGLVVMYERIGALASVVARHATTKGIALYHAQRSFLGCHFAEVGAALMRKWQLPESIANAVHHHLEPCVAGEAADIGILRLAAQLGDFEERSVGEEDLSTRLDQIGSDNASALALDSSGYRDILTGSRTELDQIQSAFSTDTASAA